MKSPFTKQKRTCPTCRELKEDYAYNWRTLGQCSDCQAKHVEAVAKTYER